MMPPDRDMIGKIVQESADSAVTETIVVRAQKSTAEELRKVIDAAKAGNRQAINKIRVFEVVKDTGVAARLALMNRAQRQNYFGELKEQRKAAARKAKRSK